ncbi:hypothetical protein BH20VER2_BH20VER2_13680 [soil metagenome]
MKLIKVITLLAFAVGALSLGACAQQRRGETMQTTTTGSTYSK